MTTPRGETWTFRMQLPADVPNAGRFVARLLKHLLRVWRVRCVATIDVQQMQAAKPEEEVQHRD